MSSPYHYDAVHSLLLLVKRQIDDDYDLKLFDCSPAIYIKLESLTIM